MRQLNGEDLSCYSNIIESISLRKCPYDHWLTNEAHLSATTVTYTSQSFLPTRWRQKSTGIDMEQNYVTVTLCIILGLLLLIITIITNRYSCYSCARGSGNVGPGESGPSSNKWFPVPESTLQQHFDRFSHFSIGHWCDQQTGRPCYLCITRAHVHALCACATA